jgi:hypothetical protein
VLLQVLLLSPGLRVQAWGQAQAHCCLHPLLLLLEGLLLAPHQLFRTPPPCHQPPVLPLLPLRYLLPALLLEVVAWPVLPLLLLAEVRQESLLLLLLQLLMLLLEVMQGVCQSQLPLLLLLLLVWMVVALGWCWQQMLGLGRLRLALL